MIFIQSHLFLLIASLIFFYHNKKQEKEAFRVKRKSIAVISIVTILALIVGLSFFLISIFSKNEDHKPNFGQVLITATKNEKITALSAEDASLVLGEWELPVFEILPDHQGNALIVITDETPHKVYRLSLNNESLDLKEIYEFDYNFTDETEIKWVEDTGVFYEPSTKVFTLINPEQLKTTEYPFTGSNLEAWTMNNDYLFYAYDHQLTALDLNQNAVVSTITFESPMSALYLKDIQVDGEPQTKLYAFSQFGQSSGFETVVNLTLPTLSIEQISSLKGQNLTFFNEILNDDLIYYSTVQGKSKRATYESYNVVEQKNEQTLTLELNEKDHVWFEQSYAYLIRENKLQVQSAFSNSVLWESPLSADWFYPLW